MNSPRAVLTLGSSDQRMRGFGNPERKYSASSLFRPVGAARPNPRRVTLVRFGRDVRNRDEALYSFSIVRRAHFVQVGLLLTLLAIAVGCGGSKSPEPNGPRDAAAPRAAPPNEAQPPKSDKADVSTGPLTSTILSVVKDQKPFILMDMAPELARLKGYTPAAQEEYLVKRALTAVRSDNVWKKKEYEGKDSFVVRMILLTELDEYGKPKWGSALEIAIVEIPRRAVAQRTREAIAALDREQARKAVENCRFSLENIEKAAAR
jgi:hypothetical protein